MPKIYQEVLRMLLASCKTGRNWTLALSITSGFWIPGNLIMWTNIKLRLNYNLFITYAPPVWNAWAANWYWGLKPAVRPQIWNAKIAPLGCQPKGAILASNFGPPEPRTGSAVSGSYSCPHYLHYLNYITASLPCSLVLHAVRWIALSDTLKVSNFNQKN